MDIPSIAWAAGFYEGEGHIRASATGIEICVVQVDREPLNRFQSAMGFGRVMPHRVAFTNTHAKQPQFAWRVYNYEHAQAAIAMMWPWLSVRRRDQALTAIRRVQSRWAQQQLCKRGHSLAEAWIDKRGARYCRACHRWRARERRQAIKEMESHSH